MKVRIFPALIIMALTVALTGCNHKELCYRHPHNSKITVKYDWSEAPDANPAGMCVFFYSTENAGEYYRFDFSNTHGGEIELPAGKYVLVTYNNDTEAVRFSSTNVFDLHTAYTRDGDLLEPLYGNGVTSNTKTDNSERVVITPDGLWGCHAVDVTITQHGITYTIEHHHGYRSGDAEVVTDDSGNQTITLFPHDMLCHYSYEVRNVENTEHVSRISASLSGMSGTMKMSDETLGSESVTLPVNGQTDPSNKKITGKFLTFGNYSTDGTVQHKMEFFVVMDDGSKYRIGNSDNLNVTTQVDNAPDPRHVHIIIDNLKLPIPNISDEGWLPTVDDWGVHEEDLKI